LGESKAVYAPLQHDCTAGSCYGWILFDNPRETNSWASETSGEAVETGQAGPIAGERLSLNGHVSPEGYHERVNLNAE